MAANQPSQVQMMQQQQQQQQNQVMQNNANQNQILQSQNIAGIQSISDLYNLNDNQKQYVIQQYTVIFMQTPNAKNLFKMWAYQNSQVVVYQQSMGANEEQIFQNWALQHVQNLIMTGIAQYENSLQRAAVSFKEHIMQAGIEKWVQMSKEQQDEYQMNWIKAFQINLSQTINLQLFSNFKTNTTEAGPNSEMQGQGENATDNDVKENTDIVNDNTIDENTEKTEVQEDQAQKEEQEAENTEQVQI